MKLLDFPLKCIEKTGRTFDNKYKEHMQAIRNNKGYSNHIVNTYIRHYRDTTDVMKIEKK